MLKETEEAEGKQGIAGPIARQYLRPVAAAEYTGLSESTLAKLRMRHRRSEGPPFIRAGGSVIYRRSDLDGWLLNLSVQE